MPDQRISMLPVADPLAGDELIPIVQDGVTRQVVYSSLIADVLDEVPTGPSVVTGTTFVPFGDSFVDVSGTQTYDDDADVGYIGAVRWMEYHLGGRLVPLNNAGVSGESTDQQLLRLQADVIDYAPKLCVWLSPMVNDIKNGRSLGAIQADVTTVLDMLRAAGILVVTATTTPSNLINDAAERAVLFAANRWLIEQGATRTGVVVVDIFSMVSDPASFAWRTGANYTTDLTHLNAVGSELVGRELARVVSMLLPAAASPYRSTSNADVTELLPNTMMLGNTAGVATSTTIAGGTGTASKVARTDGWAGEFQRWAQTSGTNTILQSATTGFSVGDRVVASCEIFCEAPFTATSHFIGIEARNASNVVVDSIKNELGFSGDMPIPTTPLFVKTNPFTVPATTTTLRWYHRMVGAGTVNIASMSIRKAP